MEYIISIVLAFIIAFSATPIAKKVAFRIGAVDTPKDGRRMHKKPIALFGGAAIAAGFIVSVLYNLIVYESLTYPGSDIIGLLAGLVIILAMGILDDILTLKAWVKLAFQCSATLAVILLSDTRIVYITNPFAGGASILSPIISYPLTFLWIIGITNAFNLIDGLDGLAAGVASISSLSLFFVSILSTVSLGSNPYTSVLTAALAGATLGFLPFNFNPAKIFMGETGSAFLGFTLGVVSIQGTLKSYTAISIAIPLLILGLPLFDTAFAILRRVVSGKSPMEADRGHLHHKLIDMGLNQKQSVLAMYIVSGALGLCAIVLANKGVFSAIILLIAVSVFVIGGARYMTEIGEKNTEDGQSDDSPSQQSQVTAAEQEHIKTEPAEADISVSNTKNA